MDPETGATKKVKPSIAAFLIRIFIQAFTLTFVAEWGDRSQLTTIILSAREDYFGIIVGGIVGHSICTGLAVIGGRMIAQKISVRTVTIIGEFCLMELSFFQEIFNEICYLRTFFALENLFSLRLYDHVSLKFEFLRLLKDFLNREIKSTLRKDFFTNLNSIYF